MLTALGVATTEVGLRSKRFFRDLFIDVNKMVVLRLGPPKLELLNF